ncbi:hypothetical protein K1719_026038 [Acacia pycnantha]|nr:hypothetical protein K1719_026038 [Acacia pycnantha]
MIDLSNNKLNGSIPRSIFRLQNLTFLNFSHNSLTGNVLLHYFSWQDMYAFDLSYNFLQGELHSSICNASNLDILNLSNNNFTGTIPQCIVGCNLNLSVLDLQMNNFSGIVPQSFDVGNNLRTLNLNGNILEGSIPQSLVNCTRLRVLDLGNNKIEDVFPHWVQALEELQVLVLRQNKLHGFIPNFGDNRSDAFPKLRAHWYNSASTGNLRNLESLDLSSNNFTRKIPAELTNLNFLGVLNLSRNELEGFIPRGQQFETFSSDSFEGNKELRGFQLMIPCTTHEERQEPLPSLEVGFEFGWKPVALGYVCGAVFGATLFQLVMFSGKPLWVANLVNDMLKKRKRRIRNRP